MLVAVHEHFVYDHIMIVVNDADAAAARIAAAIGEPARARILYCLMDGHARTSTELAVVAEVSPSTASVHLNRLLTARLIQVHVQGKHRYCSLDGPHVAKALEALSVLAGGPCHRFVPSTPSGLLAARTCYDHMAGALGVGLLDRFQALRWLAEPATIRSRAYEVTRVGAKGFEALGIDVEGARRLRRRLAYACLDWSERRPHLGGALGAAVLKVALQRRWVEQELDSRALEVTSRGRREMQARLGLQA
jgi:DNA-binding transcriptional ArsR family regulator